MRSSLMMEREARNETERDERDDLEETQNEADEFRSIPPWKSQITFRGIVASIIIGIIYSVIVMKLNLTTGLVPNLNVSAALLAFVFLRSWTKLLTKAGIVTKPFTKQENTVVQTCAVACYSIAVGGGFGSYLLGLSTKTYEQSGTHTEGNSPGSIKEPGIGWMTAFLFFTCFVGLLALVPLRKIMIIDYKLTYPSGTATAVLINGFHTSKGNKMAKKQVFGFVKYFSFSFIWAFFQWFFTGISGTECGFIQFPTFGLKAWKNSFYFDFSMTYIGAGMICSHIVNLSLLFGAVLSWGIMWPLIKGLSGDWYPSTLPQSSMKSLNGYKVFVSISLILGDGLYHFIKILMFTARNIYSKLKNHHSGKSNSEKDKQSIADLKRDEIFVRDSIPLWVAAVGYAAFSVVSIIAIPMMFPELKWYFIVVAYMLAPSLGFSNAYGAGLTDMNMAYNYGKVALFILAAMAGKQDGVVAGLVGCGLIKSIVSISSDLMHDFKTGHLTLTSPRSMLVSQAIGTGIGCVVAPLTFFLFYKAFDVGNPEGEYKAPYALIYRNMAILGVEGFSALPQHCLQLCYGFFAFAVAANLVRDMSPEKIGKWVPLPMAMAVPFLVGGYFAIDMCADDHHLFGATANISSLNETKTQYTTLRHFPADSRKYCYTLNVTSRNRYLVRATFLYGNFDSNNVYPKFDISLGATHWTTIVISEAATVETAELVFLASSPSVSVCLSNATTGQPFISTLELRQLNGSMYLTEFEDKFHLSVSARINFGAETEDPVRYPDDPYDRIWESDLLKKANYLVDVAAGTMRVSTTSPIDNGAVMDKPPQKVMQTAVVGTNGSLTYRMNLEGFPGNGRAFTYFAEIEDLAEDESRKFRLILPDHPEYSKSIVDVKENTQRAYKVYEPGYVNITLPYVLNFRFAKTADSSRGPILNAMEISKYLEKSGGSVDASVMADLASLYSSTVWGQEGGDPCLPSPWSWVTCSSDPQPRVVAVKLSEMNLTGDIPSELTQLTGLVELMLDGNSLTGSIPDFSRCLNLKIIHLENNRLTGKIPSSLAKLPNLTELYLQNNLLTGKIPSSLTKNVISNFTGNFNLKESGDKGRKLGVIIGASVGAIVLLIVTIISLMCMCKLKEDNKMRKTSAELTTRPTHVQRASSTLSEAHGDAAHCFTLYEIEEATNKFEKRIGSGGFGIVYYGLTKEGKEIAVKVLGNNSYQGKREFANEVTLLSRIHHRNLVQFLGYCQEEGRNMLVYEFMHNGTLKEHLYGVVPRDRRISWIKRLEIAEDAARGIEYLHTGCVPAIIHRDLKTSNILLDKHMRAKVSDFGLSKLAVDGTSHVSSIVRGTVGYLDPEYYISQQLTEKSDVYSFGVILLELISGQEAISNENFGANCRNIVQWAKMHIDNGDIRGIIDPALAEDDYSLQSMWKIAEKALLCVKPHGNMRPSMSEVQKDIQDAIRMEKEALVGRGGISDEFSRSSAHSSSFNMGMRDNYVSIDESVLTPTAR